MRKQFLILGFAAWLASFAVPALAYLDPASGSMLLQLILGGVAGLAVAVKLYWRRLLAFFGSKRQDPEDSAP